MYRLISYKLTAVTPKRSVVVIYSVVTLIYLIFNLEVKSISLNLNLLVLKNHVICRLLQELRIWNTRHHSCVQCVALSPPLTRHWAGTHSLYLWHGDDSGVLVALGPRLAEIPLESPRGESSSSCSFQSDESSSSNVDKPLWQDQQVKSLVERAHELHVELSGLTSEVPSTAPSPHEDDFLLENPTIPELNLNLDAFPKTTFKRPQFPPSALEVINLR